jgi:hypothetical protein
VIVAVGDRHSRSRIARAVMVQLVSLRRHAGTRCAEPP